MPGHRRRKATPKRPAPVRTTLRIENLGRHGDGVAHAGGKRVFVAYALAGETVEAEVAGERGTLIGVLDPSPDRIPAPCPVFGICGGCAVQHLADGAYTAWKRGIVETALANRALAVPVGEMIDAHGTGRRRVTVHAQYEAGGGRVGFHERRGNAIVAVETCPVLCADLAPVFAVARALADALQANLRVTATATDTGLDVAVSGAGDAARTLAGREALADIATGFDLARLAVDGEAVAERRRPVLAMGSASVTVPPAGFLQATKACEAALAALVLDAAPDAGLAVDLFCGAGPFALRLAGRQPVLAVDADASALAALDAARRSTQRLKPVTVERRDLFESPMAPHELANAACVVFDPPRAGAEAQARALAASVVPVVIAVSCDPATFARDAAILVQGGYRLDAVTPLDQFRHTAHVEIVGVFRRGGCG